MNNSFCTSYIFLKLSSSKFYNCPLLPSIQKTLATTLDLEMKKIRKKPDSEILMIFHT